MAESQRTVVMLGPCLKLHPVFLRSQPSEGPVTHYQSVILLETTEGIKPEGRAVRVPKKAPRQVLHTLQAIVWFAPHEGYGTPLPGYFPAMD